MKKLCKSVHLDGLDRRARLVRAGLDPVEFGKVLAVLARRYEGHWLNEPAGPVKTQGPLPSGAPVQP